MSRMSDLGERLRRASGLVPGPDDPFERLTRRRDRKRRNERLVAGAVVVGRFQNFAALLQIDPDDEAAVSSA